jgi:hypothetical protein
MGTLTTKNPTKRDHSDTSGHSHTATTAKGIKAITILSGIICFWKSITEIVINMQYIAVAQANNKEKPKRV